MSVIKLSLSCGKDSNTALFMHLFQGDIVKTVTYIPYFTDNIPLLLKSDYEFILDFLDVIRSYGVDVYLAKGMTYFDHVFSIQKTLGKIHGFPIPITGKCTFLGASKRKALNSVDVGYFDYQDVGICFDEPDRFKRLDSSKCSILYDNHITQKQTFDFCKKNGFLLLSYSLFKRNGCTLCYNGNAYRRCLWYRDYPEAYDILRFMQEYVISARPERLPLRNGNLFFDPLQLEVLL